MEVNDFVDWCHILSLTCSKAGIIEIVEPLLRNSMLVFNVPTKNEKH